MLCIDRALMSRPHLQLLDEPSMGLAPIVVRQVFDLVRDIRAEGMAVLLVEQNARAEIRVADTAYVTDSGAVACEHVGRRNQWSQTAGIHCGRSAMKPYA